ncbi:MAG: hypothetical protein PUB42_08010 [Firmicutes bacterium]|nr:hypothetical protein [Bacillota bacterium]
MLGVIENGKLRVFNSAEDIDPKETELKRVATAYEEMLKEERELYGEDEDNIEFWNSPVGRSFLANPQSLVDLLTGREENE